ncbi:TolC family protein [Myxococcota bacterium]|nr:TolC family protein [Myxococcota bacterium]MBU1379524.1 TolC family protein [Myxococcota bacterium]MBU1498958.1 TolC family protein [Myxococcota bacterium]
MIKLNIFAACLTLSVCFSANAQVKTIPPKFENKTDPGKITTSSPVTKLAKPNTSVPVKKDPEKNEISSYSVSKPVNFSYGKPLTLKDSIKTALKKNPELKLGELKIEESRLLYQAQQRNILPKISLEATFLRWDSALPMSFGSPSNMVIPEDCPIGCMSFLASMFSDLGNLREMYTQNYKITVVQPITASFAILNMIKARKIDIDVSEIENDLNILSVKFKVVNAYIQVLQAREFLKVTEKSEILLREHLKRAMKFYKAELISKSEILRLNTALGNAVQQRLEAQSGYSIASEVLKMHMGISDKTVFNPTENFPIPASPVQISFDEALRTMEANRKEIKTLKKKLEIVRLSHKASQTMALPSANVMFQWEHNEGLGSLQPATSWFVGINLSYTFEWNKKLLEADHVKAQMYRIMAAERQLNLALRVNLKTSLEKVRTSWNKISIAKTALKEARETLRLEELQFSVSNKTSISLLDAQTRYDGASVNLVNSIYEYYKNVANLMYAMGTGHIKGSNLTW